MEDKEFSSNDNAEVTPEAEVVIHSFKDNNEIDDEGSLDDDTK